MYIYNTVMFIYKAQERSETKKKLQTARTLQDLYDNPHEHQFTAATLCPERKPYSFTVN